MGGNAACQPAPCCSMKKRGQSSPSVEGTGRGEAGECKMGKPRKEKK